MSRHFTLQCHILHQHLSSSSTSVCWLSLGEIAELFRKPSSRSFAAGTCVFLSNCCGLDVKEKLQPAGIFLVLVLVHVRRSSRSSCRIGVQTLVYPARLSASRAVLAITV